MVNNPELIQKIITQIENLTFEQLDFAIKETDKIFKDNIQVETCYTEDNRYAFSKKLNDYKTLHSRTKKIEEAA